MISVEQLLFFRKDLNEINNDNCSVNHPLQLIGTETKMGAVICIISTNYKIRFVKSHDENVETETANKTLI